MLRSFCCSQLFLSSVLLAASSSQLAAQDVFASVEGQVTSAEGPVEGALVEIIELERQASTNSDGRYSFVGVPHGRFTLQINLLGWSTHETEFRVDGNVTLSSSFLQRAAIELTPVQVINRRVRLSESAVDVPGSVQVLDRADLERTASAVDDVHQFLRQLPGVNVQEEDGYGLRPNIGLRGSGTERSSKITLMEDGVLIAPAPYSAPSAYYFPVAGRMSAIEVRKGSSQIRYGPRTTGGALNLVSSPIPSRMSLDVDGAVGADATRRLHVRGGGSSDRIGWLAETYQLGSNGFKQISGGGQTGFDVHDYLGKLRFSTDQSAPGPYQEVELKLGLYDEKSDETYLGLTDEDFALQPLLRYAASREDLMQVDQSQVSLRHFVQFGPSLDITTTAYRHDVARNWYKLQSVRGTGIGSVLATPDAFSTELTILRGGDSGPGDLRVRANNREYDSRGIQTAIGTGTSLFGARHEVELGIRYHWDREDRFQHEDSYTMSAGRMMLEESGQPGSQSNRVSEATAWAFYLQDRVDFGRLTLTPGLRFETIDFTRTDYAADDLGRNSPTRVRENGVTVALPGVGASFRPTGGWRLFAGAHRGFAPPGPGADEETEAESSTNYELGAAVDLASSTGELVFFLNDYDNVLGEATLSSGTGGTGDLFNGGEARVWGVEASAGTELGRPEGDIRVALRVAYTYTNATFLTGFESAFDEWGDVEEGDRLPYLAPHQLYGSVGLHSDDWSLDLSATYSAAMRTVAGQGPIPDGQGTDSSLVLGITTRKRLDRLGTVYASAQNLTNQTYVVARRPAGARPGLPRVIELGIRLQN